MVLFVEVSLGCSYEFLLEKNSLADQASHFVLREIHTVLVQLHGV